MRVSSLSLALLVVLACACSVASINVSARPLNRDNDDPDDFAFESIDPKHHDKARETSKRVKELNNRLYDARVALKDTMISQSNKFRDLQHAQTKSLTDRLAYLSAVNELKAYENRLELAQRELGKAKSQTAKENREMKKVDANTAEYEKKLADVMGLISKVESDDKLTPEGKSKMIKTLQEEKTKYTHELIQLRFAKTNRTQEGGDSNRVGIVRNTIKAIKEEISRLQKKAEGKEKTADLSAAAQRKAKDEFLTANDKRLNAAETIASLTEDLYQVKRKLSYLSGYKHIQPLHLRSNLGSAAAHAASVVDLGENAELSEASEASEEESSEESEAAASEESAGENSEN